MGEEKTGKHLPCTSDWDNGQKQGLVGSSESDFLKLYNFQSRLVASLKFSVWAQAHIGFGLQTDAGLFLHYLKKFRFECIFTLFQNTQFGNYREPINLCLKVVLIVIRQAT